MIRPVKIFSEIVAIKKVRECFRRIKDKKIIKILKRTFIGSLVLSVIILIIFLIPVIGIQLVCSGRGAAPSENSASSSVSDDARMLLDNLDEYRRTEASTYLTLPEWYTVFSYQEYADFLKDNSASDFPYFKAVGQYWKIYCVANKYVSANYPYNTGNHVMLSVIGISFSAENILKGIYENSIGRVTRFVNNSSIVDEDIYIYEVSREYGEFIPNDPWYAFPFGSRLVGIWTNVEFFGPHFLRKIERKIWFSSEYLVKTLYGFVIKQATYAAYGAPDPVVYMVVNNVQPDLFVKVVKFEEIAHLEGRSYIVSTPHYQGFTDIVPVLAKNGVAFSEISGNDTLVFTAVVPRAYSYDLDHGRVFLEMNILTDENKKRISIETPVEYLGEILRTLMNEGAFIEHLYDY